MFALVKEMEQILGDSVFSKVVLPFISSLMKEYQGDKTELVRCLVRSGGHQRLMPELCMDQLKGKGWLMGLKAERRGDVSHD